MQSFNRASKIFIISDKRRMLELLAVVLTGFGKIVFMDVLDRRIEFISAVTLGWVAYVFYRNKQVPGILRYWGFRVDNFLAVTKRILPFGLVAIVCFIIIGYFNGTLNLTWHIIPVLFLYPLWGTIQQFLVIALVAGNMQNLQSVRVNKSLNIFITAVLFGMIHYPFVWLMAATFVLALLYGAIYLKDRNVFVMGIFHGWLGALFFYSVVNRDPFIEVFGRLVK